MWKIQYIHSVTAPGIAVAISITVFFHFWQGAAASRSGGRSTQTEFPPKIHQPSPSIPNWLKENCGRMISSFYIRNGCGYYDLSVPFFGVDAHFNMMD